MSGDTGADVEKGRFLSNISHEIKTPINGILGMVQLLAETPLSGEQAEYVSMIRYSTHSLMRVVDDILELSRAECGEIRVRNCWFHLRALIRDLAEAFKLDAMGKRLEFRCFIDPQVPDKVYGDPEIIARVLEVLMDNAVKFTEQGWITLSIGKKAGSLFSMELEFSVFDTGIGISKEDAGSIFASFSQIDGSLARKYGGCGVGLALAKQLVETVGGSIGVRSSAGNGSEFYFSFPLKWEETPGPLPDKSRLTFSSHDSRWFVQDQKDYSGRILQSILKDWVVSVVFQPEDGRLTPVLLKKEDGNGRHRFVLFEAGSPDDGKILELFEDLDRDPVLQKESFVSVCCDPSKCDIDRCRKYGASRYVAGFIRGEDFYRVLKNSEPERDQAYKEFTPGVQSVLVKEDGPSVYVRRKKNDVPLSILLADSDSVHRGHLSRLIQRKGWGVTHAASMDHVMEELNSNPYDIILLDTKMVRSGSRLPMKFSRIHSNIGHTPVLLMSDLDSPHEIERYLKTDADGHIPKPVDADMFFRTVTRTVNRKGVFSG